MPPRRATTDRSRVPRQRFAEELRLRRTERGESLRKLGEVLGWDWSLFGKMEKGETLGGPEVVEALDQHYGTAGMFLALWELAVADTTQFKEQYRKYMKLEQEAVSLWHFGVSSVPGMLQTKGYASELLAGGGGNGKELDKHVKARLIRGELLTGPMGPQFRTILHEAVLRMALRNPNAWQEQLRHLIAVTELPNVAVQVVPFSAGLHSLDSTAVMFLRLPEGRTVAYTENAHRGELIQESCSVERLQLAYDAVRDLALPPAESRIFISRMLEEVPCDDPST
ncbi:helix-turn-helix domain-containing protein [Streptomyces sp. NPDC004838]